MKGKTTARIMVWMSLVVICILAVDSAIAAEELYDVRDYGAKPDSGEMIRLTDVKKVFIRNKNNKMTEH